MSEEEQIDKLKIELKKDQQRLIKRIKKTYCNLEKKYIEKITIFGTI